MLIRNTERLMRLSTEKPLTQACIRCIEAGVSAVQPENLIKSKLILVGQTLRVAGEERSIDLGAYDRVYVVGAGKGSLEMVHAVNRLIGPMIAAGEVASNQVKRDVMVGRVRVSPATHPLPSSLSRRATERIVHLAEKRNPHDLFFVLISGGASAMLTMPLSPVTVRDESRLVAALQRSGADIHELNIVRKHISQVKGGRLQSLIYPARSVTLSISDVVGDSPESIGSGPTSPDPSTYEDALRIIEQRLLPKDVPDSVARLIRMGIDGKVPETPKPGDKVFTSGDYFLLGSVRDALKAMEASLLSDGFSPVILTNLMEGEAKEVGRLVARIMSSDLNAGRFNALVMGGETTVHVTGHGSGGRNQELALSAAIELEGKKGVVCASIGTDGIDGSTKYAGAIVDAGTLLRARKMGLNPNVYLANNDSGGFFRKVGGAILTGRTGTNVSDVVVALRL